MKLNAAFTTHTHIVQAGPYPGFAATSLLGSKVGAVVGIKNFKQDVDMKLHRTKGEFSKFNKYKRDIQY